MQCRGARCVSSLRISYTAISHGPKQNAKGAILFVSDCRAGATRKEGRPVPDPRGTAGRKEKETKSMNIKSIVAFAAVAGSAAASADTLIVSDDPSVVRNAAVREAVRQDSTWTSENIARNPYLFLQDQIANCDKLRAKIDAQNITLIRMEKNAKRTVEEAQSSQSRYGKFLKDAKAANGSCAAGSRYYYYPVSRDGHLGFQLAAPQD